MKILNFKANPIKTEVNKITNYIKSEPILDVKPRLDENVVSRATYDEQQKIVKQFENDLTKLSNICRTANLAGLPDKGKLLRMRQESISGSLKMARLKLSTMIVSEGELNF